MEPGNPALSGINPPLSPATPHTISAEKVTRLLSLAVFTVGSLSTAGALLENSEVNLSPFVQLLGYKLFSSSPCVIVF